VTFNHRKDVIYRPAWWVPGAHAQTLWGKFFRAHCRVVTRRERWDTPDGDFVDIHRLDGPADSPRLLFLHGLEGTVESHYVGGFFEQALRRGWSADLLLFRGCGPEMNRTARFYHSGETTDISFVIDRILAERGTGPLLLAGVSLGGNVLLKYLGERGGELPPRIRAAAAVSVPFDLETGCRFIARGISRIYDRHFLKTLRVKALAKLARFPGIFDADALSRARTLYEFDNVVTAPVHGFLDAHDYYAKSSSMGWLARVDRPTLLLNAIDDPFLPSGILEAVRITAGQNPCLTVELPTHGGHVGFVGGRIPWKPFYYAEWRACEFLASHLAPAQ
jgi:predicted alpha/beta-fold hydrolase